MRKNAENRKPARIQLSGQTREIPRATLVKVAGSVGWNTFTGDDSFAFRR